MRSHWFKLVSRASASAVFELAYWALAQQQRTGALACGAPASAVRTGALASVHWPVYIFLIIEPKVWLTRSPIISFMVSLQSLMSRRYDEWDSETLPPVSSLPSV